MSTTFGKKRQEAALKKYAQRLAAGEVWAGEQLKGLRKQANANIEGKSGKTREGEVYTADQIKEARALLMAMDIAKGIEPPTIDYTKHKGFGVVVGSQPETVEEVDDRSGGAGAVAASGSGTVTAEQSRAALVKAGTGGKRGMKKAAAYNPVKEFNAGIDAIMPGKNVGPTRKAAKAAKARSKLAKVVTPEPHSKEWAQERVDAEAKQKAMEEEQRHLSWHWQGDNPPPLGPGGKALKAFFDTKAPAPPVARNRSDVKARAQIAATQQNRKLVQAGYIPGTPAVKPKVTKTKTGDLSKKRKNKNGTYSPGR